MSLKKFSRRINVIGNNVTNENVIRGELLVDEETLQKLISINPANLKSRRIFRSVETKVNEGSEKNLKVIDIEVEEQPAGELSAGAGVGKMEERLQLMFQKIIGSVKVKI